MKNIDMIVTDNLLTIIIDLSKEYGKSGSGKSVIIATTEGNVSVPDPACENKVKIGINVYKKLE